MMPAWLSGIGAKLAIAGAIVVAVLLACLKLIGIGRKQERVVAMEKGVEAIKRANTAAQNVDPSAEAIAHDPNNLDR